MVIVITGILLALSAPNFSKGYSLFMLRLTGDYLIALSSWAQAMAIGQERIYALSFSSDHHSYSLTRIKVTEDLEDQDNFEPIKGALGKIHNVPGNIRLETGLDRIEFFPDGTIDPVRIQLVSPGQKMVLSSREVRGMMMKVDSE